MSTLIKTRLSEDAKTSLRQGLKDRIRVVRGLLSEILVEEKKHNVGTTLSEEQVLTVVTREKKKYEEALMFANQSGRQDLIDENTMNLAIVKEFLPEELTDNEVLAMIAVIANDVEAKTPADMGKIMKVLSPAIKGKFDGKVASEMVKSYLLAK